ncbi:MAG: hypothetical protein RBU30_07960 [Polyangia bacterium]|jgi:hypothetical protein|nr:hypothetical protein [Polyangia bacterium]
MAEAIAEPRADPAPSLAEDPEPAKERRPKAAARPRACSVCGEPILHAQVDEPGLCGPCGLRLRLRRLPPPGAACVLCGERRRRALTLWAPSGDVVCHTCDFYLREKRPWPETLQGLERPMRRERRRSQR